MTSRDDYTEAVARLRATQHPADVKAAWLRALSKATDGNGRTDPHTRQDLAEQVTKLIEDGPQ